MITQDFRAQTKELNDNLKGVCTSYGLGCDGNEFKIITQVFQRVASIGSDPDSTYNRSGQTVQNLLSKFCAC